MSFSCMECGGLCWMFCKHICQSFYNKAWNLLQTQYPLLWTLQHNGFLTALSNTYIKQNKKKTMHTHFTRWQCKYYYIYTANKRLIWQTIYVTLQSQQQCTSWQHTVMKLQNNKSYSDEWLIPSWSWLGNPRCSSRWWWYVKRSQSTCVFYNMCNHTGYL
jgi:hypothetical protein